METRFVCGCVILREEDGTLISATPCELHAPIGQGQPLADALESPHISIGVKEEIDVKSIFGGKP